MFHVKHSKKNQMFHVKHSQKNQMFHVKHFYKSARGSGRVISVSAGGRSQWLLLGEGDALSTGLALLSVCRPALLAVLVACLR